VSADLTNYFELVFPQKDLSAWERLMTLALYASNDFKCGERFNIKLGRVAHLAGASDHSARVYLRTLNDQGILEIHGYDRTGYQITLHTPLSISGVTKQAIEETHKIDADTNDFFRDRRHVSSLLERQGGTCFIR
jgi:hypothetical protein